MAMTCGTDNGYGHGLGRPRYLASLHFHLTGLVMAIVGLWSGAWLCDAGVGVVVVFPRHSGGARRGGRLEERGQGFMKTETETETHGEFYGSMEGWIDGMGWDIKDDVQCT